MNLILEVMQKGGPYVGPRGGLWEDAKRTIPFDKKKHEAKIKKVRKAKREAEKKKPQPQLTFNFGAKVPEKGPKGPKPTPPPAPPPKAVDPVVAAVATHPAPQAIDKRAVNAIFTSPVTKANFGDKLEEVKALSPESLAFLGGKVQTLADMYAAKGKALPPNIELLEKLVDSFSDPKESEDNFETMPDDVALKLSGSAANIVESMEGFLRDGKSTSAEAMQVSFSKTVDDALAHPGIVNHPQLVKDLKAAQVESAALMATVVHSQAELDRVATRKALVAKAKVMAAGTLTDAELTTKEKEHSKLKNLAIRDARRAKSSGTPTEAKAAEDAADHADWKHGVYEGEVYRRKVDGEWGTPQGPKEQESNFETMPDDQPHAGTSDLGQELARLKSSADEAIVSRRGLGDSSVSTRLIVLANQTRELLDRNDLSDVTRGDLQSTADWLLSEAKKFEKRGAAANLGDDIRLALQTAEEYGKQVLYQGRQDKRDGKSREYIVGVALPKLNAAMDGLKKFDRVEGVTDAHRKRLDSKKVEVQAVIDTINAGPKKSVAEPLPRKGSVSFADAKDKVMAKRPRKRKRGDELSLVHRPSGETRIKDSGKHVWGSRYDLAQIQKMVEAGDLVIDGTSLGEMNHEDARYLVKKQNLVEMPTLEAMRKHGMTPGAAIQVTAIIAAVKKAPNDSPESRAQYVSDLRRLEASLYRVQNTKDINELIGDWGRDGLELPTRIVVQEHIQDRSEAHKAARDYTKQTGKKHEVYYQSSYGHSSGSSYKVARKGDRPFESLGDPLSKMIDIRSRNTPKWWRSAKDLAYRADSEEISGEGNGWAVLGSNGDSKDEKKAAKAQATREARKKLAEQGIGITKRGFSEVKATRDVNRVNSEPLPDEASSDRIQGDFGLVGVQYGEEEYMTQADREHHTKQLEASMHNFANVVGAPPKAMALDGKLAIAIGARGRGKASAHYEQAHKIINLTKFNGGGTLAHEWGHALDNVLGERFGLRYVPKAGIYLSHMADYTDGEFEAVPEPIRRAIGDFVDVLRKGGDNPEVKDRRRAELKELRASRQSNVTSANAMLAVMSDLKRRVDPSKIPSMVKARQERLKEYKAELKGRKGAHKRLAAKSKANGTGTMAYLKRAGDIGALARQIEKYEAATVEIQSGGRTVREGDSAKYDQLSAEHSARVAIDKDYSKKERVLVKTIDSGMSEYMANSLEAGKQYWGSDREMFARAFETFIFDKMAESGMKDTYLASNNGDHPLYPQGDERKQFNTAIQNLLDAVKAEGVLQKALALILPLLPTQPEQQRLVLRKSLRKHPTERLTVALSVKA
jgi:hypothetical protein